MRQLRTHCASCTSSLGRDSRAPRIKGSRREEAGALCIRLHRRLGTFLRPHVGIGHTWVESRCLTCYVILELVDQRQSWHTRRLLRATSIWRRCSARLGLRRLGYYNPCYFAACWRAQKLIRIRRHRLVVAWCAALMSASSCCALGTHQLECPRACIAYCRRLLSIRKQRHGVELLARSKSTIREDLMR
jgi:hypothetical protein